MDSFYGYPSIARAESVLQIIEEDLLTTATECELDASIKLHGSNAAIVKHSLNGPLTFQSRSRLITPTDDNAGFATTMTKNMDIVLNIFEQIEKIDENIIYPVIVFGEWCGKGIQKNVALNTLNDKIFVIFDIAFSSQKLWQSMDKYASVKSAPLIRNVREVPSFKFTLKRNERQACIDAVKKKVNEIDQVCPFVYYLYGLKGFGEGLVVRPASSTNPDHWWKCKGENHVIKIPTDKLKAPMSDDPEIVALNQFASKYVTWERVLSAKEALHLRENTNDLMRAFPKINKWVFDDIEREEPEIKDTNPKLRKQAFTRRLKEIILCCE